MDKCQFLQIQCQINEQSWVNFDKFFKLLLDIVQSDEMQECAEPIIALIEDIRNSSLQKLTLV